MNIHPESRVRERFDPDQMSEAGGFEHESDAFSLSSIIEVVWDHRWLLLATTGTALGISAWQLENETRLYTTTAQVVLETARTNVVDIESVVPQRVGSYLTINTELRLLRSTDLMAKTVAVMSLEEDPEFNPALREPAASKATIDFDGLWAAVGLAPEPRPELLPPEQARQVATGILNSKVSIRPVDETLIFNITVTTEAPGKSAAIANTIAELYVDGQREEKFEAMEKAMAWLGTRVVELKTELEEAEAEIEEFAARATLVSEETLSVNKQRLKSMRVREDELGDRAARLRQRIERLTALRTNGDFAALAAAVDDPQVRAAASAAAQGDGASTATPPADDPALARFDRLFERWLDGLAADANRAEEQLAAAARSVSELEQMVDSQSADMVTLRQMEREAEATRLIYESFLGRLKEVSVQQGIQQADSRILSQAIPPGAPSHPQVRPRLMKNGMIGLVIGLVLVGLRTVLRRTVQNPEELEAATGLSVLGVIPDYPNPRADKLLRHIVEKPASRLAEAVRSLRTGIQLSNIDVTPRVVLVTSSVPEEGKSILAAVLAQTTALSGKKILLIDCDLRRKILRTYFDMEASAGLVSLLSGQTSLTETMHHDEKTGLDLILADDQKVTPVDFFGSQHFADFIAAARQDYDLIILDSPPTLAVPDARVIAQQADFVVYTVRWHSTTRRMITTGLDLLRQGNVGGIGLALNRVNPKRMDRYGYYGYGYSYGYGSGSRKLQNYYSG